MSELGKQSGICKGICKKFKTDLPISGSRYGSGQSYCNLCETWTNHLGCHLKNGNPAQENTVGWYCNCCNYRVRQKPRSKKSKEILSKDTAIALKAEISKYSDTFDVSETQKLIEETVNIVTENLLKEWLNVNMDKIVKNAIKEELANLAKKKTSSKK